MTEDPPRNLLHRIASALGLTNDTGAARRREVVRTLDAPLDAGVLRTVTREHVAPVANRLIAEAAGRAVESVTDEPRPGDLQLAARFERLGARTGRDVVELVDVGGDAVTDFAAELLVARGGGDRLDDRVGLRFTALYLEAAGSDPMDVDDPLLPWAGDADQAARIREVHLRIAARYPDDDRSA